MEAESEAILTQLRKGVLEYCVLAELRGGPSYGLELAHRLTARQSLLTSAGSLYPLLSRLRKQGRVAASWRESSAGPPRQYFSLTDSGRAALEAFALAWAPFTRDVRSILEEES